MVIQTLVRRASQGLPTTTGGDHHWWDFRYSQMLTLR